MISFTAHGRGDDHVVGRVAALICGEPRDVWRMDSGFKWQIGAGNDHWLVREGSTWRLVFRFQRDEEVLTAVRVLLERLVGFTDVRTL